MKIKHILFAVTAAGVSVVVSNLNPPEPAAATGETYYYQRLGDPGDVRVTDTLWNSSTIEVYVNQVSGSVPLFPWPASSCGSLGSRPLHGATMRLGPGVGGDGSVGFELSFDAANDIVNAPALFKGISNETKVCCLDASHAVMTSCDGTETYAVYRGTMERQ